MGSWNKTCGLSNLHITAGTPVYVFVLERNKTYEHCYSTGLFAPLLLPFESVYDDYGGGDDSSGPALDYIMNMIKKDLVEMEVGDNQYHDIAVKKEGFDAEKFFEAVHEDRLSIQDRFSAEPTQLYFTMMRKDIVDDILANRTIEEYVGGNKGTIAKWNGEKNYIQYKFADLVADIRPLLNDAMEIIGKASKEDRAFKMMSGFEYMFDRDYENKVLKWVRGDGYRYSRIVDMKRVISKGLEIGTVDSINKVAALLEEYLKGIYIDSFMESARKLWVPGGHEGSQSSSGGALRLLGAATVRALDREKAEWMADMGEEADENEYLEG
jgi:hypothetical protein